MKAPVDVIADLFGSAAGREYLGEPVTVAAHMLHAGALAEAAGAPPALIAAALLHDVGHLPLAGGPGPGEHEERGAAWLSAWFPVQVTEPVRLHVAAKRYLCAVESGYFTRLSEASVRSLLEQGGPMTPRQAREFEAGPYAADAVAVRRWDEQAKDPWASTPDFGHFRGLLQALLALASPSHKELER